MTDAKPFADKLALVTGASRGIGAAIAEALAADGAHVLLVARGAPALEAVEQRIHDAGGNATIAPMDLTDSDAIAKLAEAVGERWGALDMLVLNAAMLGSLTPVEHIDPKEYGRIIATNLIANQALIAAFDPLLRRSPAAEIVGITSSVGREPRAFWGGLWVVQGGVRDAARRLCRRDRAQRPDPRPHRRSRRDPHPDARARLPRRGARKRQAARSGRRRDRRAAEVRRADRRQCPGRG